MGVVYRAHHVILDRDVALKVLAPELGNDTSFRQRFERESRIAAGLDHPNVIPIFEAGEVEGLLFLAMRYVEGPDLGAILRANGTIPVERALDLTSQLASALDAAHARKLIHRDVKPENVLLAAGHGRGGTDHIYLTDFGLTKRSASTSGPTQLGQVVGTIDYIAPEQITGGAVDGRADVYALGCVLIKMLSGHAPFEREHDLATIAAHLHTPPPSLASLGSDLPAALDGVIAKALAKDPASRYATAGEMATAAREAFGSVATATAPREESRTVVFPAAAAAATADVAPDKSTIRGGEPPSTTGEQRPVADGNRRRRLGAAVAVAAVLALAYASLVFAGFLPSPLGGGVSDIRTAGPSAATTPGPSVTGTQAPASGPKTASPTRRTTEPGPTATVPSTTPDFTTAPTPGIADADPPVGIVLINDGAASTAVADVTLTLDVTDPSGVSLVKIANDAAALADAPEMPFAPTMGWTLGPPDALGLRTVYVVWRDAVGNWSTEPATAVIADGSEINPPGNRAPTCNSRTMSVQAGSNNSVSPSCTDQDGDNLTFTIASQGSKGSASVTAGEQLRYEANANATGQDTFTYRASDGNGGTDTATVTVTITAPTATVQAARLTAPGGASFSGTTETFRWTTVDDATVYSLWITDRSPSEGLWVRCPPGDICGVENQTTWNAMKAEWSESGMSPNTHAWVIDNLPTDGRNMWVRMLTKRPDGRWYWRDYAFNAASSTAPGVHATVSGKLL
jgi:Protein kinase domain/Bacterial Ig domain